MVHTCLATSFTPRISGVGLSLARVVVTSILAEKRSKAAVARDYGLSRRRAHEPVRRFQAEGEAGLEPRSRAPKASPHQLPEELEQQIVELRKRLRDEGLDAGAHTIPAAAYAARPKSTPDGARIPVHCRVRRDRIDRGGGVTLRHDTVLRHIKVGHRHAGTRILMLVAGLNVRIVSRDGELIRELTLDPSQIYQPMG